MSPLAVGARSARARSGVEAIDSPEAIESKPDSRARSLALRAAAAVLVALLAIGLRLPELDRYATIDESRWVSRAADFAVYLQQGDLDNTYLVGHPGVTTMWLGSLGLGAERVRDFSFLEGQTDVTRRDGYLEALVAARQPALVASSLALGGLVWLAWGLLGPGAALLGGLLLITDPFLAAHSRLIHLDALLSSFLSLAAISAVAFWSGRSWLYLLSCGLFSGLALLTKAPSVYLLVFVPGLALFEHLRGGGWQRPTGWVRLVAGLVIWIAAAWAVCLALWPAFRLKPLAVLAQMADFTVKNGGGEHDNFFLGQQVADPGPLFYPLALLFRASPLMLLGLALLGFFLIRRRLQLPSFWPTLLLLGWAGGFLLMMSLGQKKFDRYELPLFPILGLLSGQGLWLAWSSFSQLRAAHERERVADRPSLPLPTARALSLSALLALVTVAAWPLVSVYPYHLAYYNPLLGGGAVAQRLLFVGWGEALDQVAAYLNAKPIVLQAPTVATAYHRALQAHLHEKSALPLERAELADYVVPYVNSTQRDQQAELLSQLLSGQGPEHVVTINGIEYARIYRGPHLPVDRVVGASFGGRLRLESFVFAPGSGRARPGDDLLLRLRWRAEAEASALTSTLQVVGSDGRPVLEQRQPLARARREDGLLVADSQLSLPARLPAGDYRLLLLVEDASGRRLAPAQPDDALSLLTLTIGPAVAP